MIKYTDIEGEKINSLVNGLFPLNGTIFNDNTITVKNIGDGVETKAFVTACNMVRVTADISGEFKTARISVKIQRNDGGEELITLNDCVPGHFCETFDAANFAVYHDAKEFKIHIASMGDYGFITIENLEVCPLDKLQQSAYYDKDFSQMLDNVFSEIDRLRSEIGIRLPVAVSPNGRKFTIGVDDDGNIISIPNVPKKTVMLGNSLLLGMQFYGMCASAPDKDYAFYIQQEILKRCPTATFDKIFASPFETAETDEMYETWWENPSTRGTKKTVKDIFTSDTELIIVQLGDNVNNTARVNAFPKHADRLISSMRALCPRARIIWVMGFYNRRNTYDMLSALSRKWAFPIVDISDLNVAENQSFSGAEYTLEDGTKAIVKDGWITHPGDEGMKKIAERIIDAIDM